MKQLFFIDLRLVSLLLVRTLIAQSSPVVGSTPENVTVKTPGFTDVELASVQLSRYSKELGRWVPDFRATRRIDAHPLGNIVDFRVVLSMKDGRNSVLDLKQNGTSLEYSIADGLYKPEDVVSYQILITRESWVDEQAAADQNRKEEHAIEARERINQGKRRSTCSIIYKRTADKKVSDLTVKESYAVRACESLGLYPP